LIYNHIVKKGETLATIANQYQVSTQDIVKQNPVLSSANGILYVGQILKIPKKIKVEGQDKAVSQTKSAVKVATKQKPDSFSSTKTPLLSWPVLGVLTSKYGPRWGTVHRGIDIWHPDEFKTPIKAALSGIVIEAGWFGGYGNYVKMDHGNGVVTLYAHLRRITVKVGEHLARGANLGYMGQSGDATGPHLHFEVRINGRPQNPLLFLKRR